MKITKNEIIGFIWQHVLLLLSMFRRKFETIQLFQLLVGFVFGCFLDINMWITSYLPYDTLVYQIIAQLMGATILGCAVAAEIRCCSVTMPGEGIQVARSAHAK